MNIVELLSDILHIQSYSSKESALVDYISRWCKNRFLPYSVHNENVLIQLGNPYADRRLLFNAHMDVVSGDNWRNDEIPDQVSAFDPRVKNGRMYGRGAADTKAGLAAMMLLAERLMNENEILKDLAVDIAFTRAEEANVEDNGVAYLCQNGLLKRPTAAVIAEPSNLEVLIGSGGIAQYFFSGPFVTNKKFGYVNKSALRLIPNLRDAVSAIDRAVLFCAKHAIEGKPLPSFISAGDAASSIRPHIATLEGMNETIVCTDAVLRGHPAYAQYSDQVYRDLIALIPEYEPFDLLSAALQVMRFRAQTHMDGTSVYFAPLPTFEFTYFGKDRFQISCRLSPEVTLEQLRSWLSGCRVSYGLWEEDAREAVFTDPSERIVKVAQTAVQNFFNGTQCVNIQRGASDAQLLRQYFQDVPFILLSAGSGVMTDEGSTEKAPTFLSTSHQPNEFVDVAQIEKLPGIYFKIIDYFSTSNPISVK